MIRRSLLLAGLLTITAPAAHAGAVTLEESRNFTPVAAHGGVMAWNLYDQATDSTRIRYSVNGGPPQDAKVAPGKRGFDLDLGPGANGGVALVFTRCDGADCDVWRLDDLGRGTARPVPGASSDRRTEYLASIDGDQVVFAATPPRGYARRFPVLWSVRPGARPRPLTELPHQFCRRTCERADHGTLTDIELDRGRVAAAYQLNRGETTRWNQILVLERRAERWRQIARASSGALSSANLFSPAFAPGNRIVFAHTRIAGSVAPQIASVRLSGAPQLQELTFTGVPHSLDVGGDGSIALATLGSLEVAGPTSVQRLDAPEFRPAQPRGYSLVLP